MEKLIHERLREIANNRWLASLDVDESSSRDAIDIVRESLSYVEESMSYCVDMQNILNYIADEIEKYYDPKPRDTEGNPVHKDMEVDGGIVDDWRVHASGRWYLYDKEKSVPIQYGNKDDLIQLPQSKVLDADGVETKVGDTVWIVESGDKGKVEEINKDRAYVKCDDGWLADVHVSNIAHHKPDSLEKLLVELRGVDFIPSKEYLNHIADRLTAIMERDA